MNLQKKFLFIFLAVSAFPVLIISLYTYGRYKRLAETQIQQVSENILSISSARAEDALETLSHITETIYLPGQDHVSILDDLKPYNDGASPSEEKIFYLNEMIKSSLQSYIYNDPYINGVFLFLPDGTVLGGGYGNDVSVKYDYHAPDAEWYRETIAQKGRTLIYGPCSKEMFTDSENVSLSFCTALYGTYDHILTAVLLVDCDPAFFDLSTVNPLPSIAELSVLNEGNVLYSTEKVIPDNSTVLTYTKPLSLEPLVLEARIGQKNLYREFGITLIALTAVLAIALMVVILISWILSRNLTRPIITLSGMMQQPEEFPDASELPYFNRGDEIGTLYTSYQKMLDDRNLYVKNEFENKLILLDSQMKSLESQINAHFLYNTLESINSIATVEKVPAISTMSLALGRMFRYSIKTESELVPLSQEIIHVKDYSTIQEIRFNHRYSLQTDIPKELEQITVLKLILQPLVENALYHGLQYCRSGDTIVLKARREGRSLLLSVEDNGVGIPPGKLEELKAQLQKSPEFTELGQRREEGIGVVNIHSRIRLYYGEPYGLNLDDQPEKGARFTILLPVLSEPDIYF